MACENRCRFPLSSLGSSIASQEWAEVRIGHSIRRALASCQWRHGAYCGRRQPCEMWCCGGDIARPLWSILDR